MDKILAGKVVHSLGHLHDESKEIFHHEILERKERYKQGLVQMKSFSLKVTLSIEQKCYVRKVIKYILINF